MTRMSPHMAGLHRRRRRWSAMVLAAALACAAAPIGAQAQARADACEESLADMFDRVSPAVVSIGATSINPYRLSERVTHVVGSGVLVDAEGLILTNSHVAYGRQSITVTLDDGRRLPARLVGADPIFDLALLRISVPPSERLATVALGDSDRVRVGDDVVAIGNPIGLDQTLTRGIVSGMSIAAALGLDSEIAIHLRDECAEAAALKNIALWAGQWTSTIAIEPPANVLLEISGCLNYFGGLSTLLGRIDAGLAAIGFPALVATAPTAPAASLLARAGRAITIDVGGTSSCTRSKRMRVTPAPRPCRNPASSTTKRLTAKSKASVSSTGEGSSSWP